jgi:uncharacterized oxidoreductase
MNFEQSRILVTGGTSGIGRELVAQLVGLGCRVVTCGKDAHRCARLREEFPEVLVIDGDLGQLGVPSEIVRQAVDYLGGLDMVVNNAGVQFIEDYLSGDFREIAERGRRQIEVNVTAPLELATVSLPYLAESELPRLVFVTSGLALFPKKSAPVYCATKSALRTFVMSLRYQLEDGGSPIKVIDAVLPLVDTPMTAGRGRESEKMSPVDVAATIITALQVPRPVVWIGKAKLLPWLTRLAPTIGRRALRNS